MLIRETDILGSLDNVVEPDARSLSRAPVLGQLISSSEDVSDTDLAPTRGEAPDQEDTPAVVDVLAPTQRRDLTEEVIDLTADSGEEVGPDRANDGHDAQSTKLTAVAAATANIHSYKGREEKHKRMKRKNNPWGKKISRKPKYQARRATTRDSKRIYHAKTMQTKFIQQYLAIPGVLEALKALRAEEEGEKKEPACVIADAFGPDVAPEIAGQETAEVAASDGVPWPVQITHSLELNVKDGVAVKDSWPADRCSCIANCFPHSCMNAATRLFCAADNCIFQGRCSNGIHETQHVELFQSAIGVGVRAKEGIPLGATIAPYTGLLTDHDFDKDPRQWEYVISLQTKGRGNKKLFIDAEEWGTVARFINHSCEPNTEFLEMRHNKEVHVLVKTTKKIAAGKEITADYGTSTWFEHACKTPKCRQRQDSTVQAP